MSAPTKHVAILGGGLAGMSAAAALAQEGYRVTLVQKRATLGGRAGFPSGCHFRGLGG